MKIAMAQMRVVSGRLEENFEVIKAQVTKAKKEKADIIVFPEMCVSGYLLADTWLDHEYCSTIHSYNDKIKALSTDIGIIFGNLYYDVLNHVEIGRDGRKARFNCAFFAYNLHWVKRVDNAMDGIHVKHALPDYRIFDDSRYFISGIQLAQSAGLKHSISPFLFDRNGITHRVGLEVCEDFWNQNDSVDVSECLVNEEVEFIVNISSSPFTIHKEKARDKKALAHAHKHKDKTVPFIYVNACGMQNSGKNIVLFDGDSCVYNQKGERVFSLNDRFKEQLSYYDFNATNSQSLSSTKLLDALTYAIQEVDKQMFSSSIKWIIGLSGGIDSCINACLLVKALGSERVIAYNMASTYNSLTTKNNAKQVADSLGIELREGSIEELNSATISTMNNYGYTDEYSSLVYENIQARIRGHLLSTFASIEGGVVINNGNKIEVALGYCTLYGDCIGAFSPLGDLTKVQCFEIAKQCNAYFNKEVISHTLIPEVVNDDIIWDMPPSAELKDAQLDPMKWFYHDALITHLLEYPTAHIEDIMQSYLDDKIYESDLGKWIRYYHLDIPSAFIDDLEWLLRTMQNAAFKRIQMPPVLLLSRGAYGNDFREAQLGFVTSQRYQQLKQEILKKKS